MNKFEKKLRSEKKCICCGQPVTVSNSKINGTTWPKECKACRDMSSHEVEPDGIGTKMGINMSNEYKLRMGYSFKDAV